MDCSKNPAFTSYGLTFLEQATAYLNTLHSHPEGLMGGKVLLISGNFGQPVGLTCENMIRRLAECQDDYKYTGAYVALNTYHKGKKFENLRCEKNLWGLDTIMIDIDATSIDDTYPLSGLEDELVSALFNAALNGDIPMFNAFSYTGSGGIHLYYTFKRLPKQMKKPVMGVKYLFATMIAPVVAEYSQKTGRDYKLDTKVFDNQRIDRLPGSINKKTGRMCEFFTTGLEKYTFQELLSVDENSLYNWDQLIKEAKDYLHSDMIGSSYVPKFDLKLYKKGFMGLKKGPKVKHAKSATVSKRKRPKFDKYILSKNRMQNLLALSESGYNMIGHRETAGFLMNLFTLTAELPEEERIQWLEKLNNSFAEPLPERELKVDCKVSKIYFVKDSTIAEMLDLDPSSEEYRIMFPVKKGQNQPVRKINGISEFEWDCIKEVIYLSKIRVENPDCSQREFAALADRNMSAIKNIRSYFTYFPDIEYEWACKDITNKDDLEWIRVNYMEKSAFDIIRRRKDHLPLDEYENFTKALIEIREKEIQEAKTAKVQKTSECGTTPLNLNDVLHIALKRINNKPRKINSDLALLPCEFLEIDKKVMRKIKSYEKNPSKKSLWHKDYKTTKTIMKDVSIAYNWVFTEGSEQYRKSIEVLKRVMKERWLMPQNLINELVYGRITYSTEYYANKLEHYINNLQGHDIPEPHACPYYKGQIKECRKFTPKVFVYRPPVLQKYLHGNSPSDMLAYKSWYPHAKYLKEQIKSCKNTYKKACNDWNVLMANQYAKYVDEAISKLEQYESDFVKSVEMPIVEQNIMLKRDFITMAEERKAAGIPPVREKVIDLDYLMYLMAHISAFNTVS